MSGYIYSTELLKDGQSMKDIPDAVTADHAVPIEHCEFVPDAYEAIMNAVDAGTIVLEKYENISEAMQDWIYRTIRQDYEEAENTPDYRYFLETKFPFVTEK